VMQNSTLLRGVNRKTNRWLVGAAVAVMSSFGSAAFATTIDLNTGNGSNPYIITADSLSPDENTALPTPAVVVTALGGSWVNDLSSEWIAPLANQSNSARSGVADLGSVTYDVTFDLPANLSGSTLSLTLAADDWVMISLNGHSAFYTGSSTGQWTNDVSIPISALVNSELVSGANTLQFVVYNTGTGSDKGGGPTGLDVQGAVDYTPITAPGATTVPEPMTLSLFGFGLAGAAAMRRRKNKSA
jgi:hypothetical protein